MSILDKGEKWEPNPIIISARLYEELQQYLALQSGTEPAQLLRRLRESNGR